MNFNRRDVVIGFVIIVVIVLGAFLFKKLKFPSLKISKATPTPESVSFRDVLENDFKYDIPDDANTIELKDVSGGDARGIATEKEALVDANDPETGYFYQAWFQDVNSGNLMSLGKLQINKGGWLIEYNKSNYPNASNIIISLEKVFDTNLEKKILEGSFN